jgi:hypothetical protein
MQKDAKIRVHHPISILAPRSSKLKAMQNKIGEGVDAGCKRAAR